MLRLVVKPLESKHLEESVYEFFLSYRGLILHPSTMVGAAEDTFFDEIIIYQEIQEQYHVVKTEMYRYGSTVPH